MLKGRDDVGPLHRERQPKKGIKASEERRREVLRVI